MIFEALSALADANGSDVGSIFSFIEVRQVSLVLFYLALIRRQNLIVEYVKTVPNDLL